MEILKVLVNLKKFLFKTSDNKKKEFLNILELNPKPEQEPPSLSVYEFRRKEIEESNEQIEGVFYFYDNKIVPDYYSEHLLSDKKMNADIKCTTCIFMLTTCIKNSTN